MNIYLYTSSAEPNSFPKELGEAVKIEGTLRDECDILNPVITLVGFNPANTFNYCYIPDFKRYYFITESSVVRTNVMELTMHVDVLQSWSNQILEQEGVILRNEYDYNVWLPDERVPIQSNNEYVFIKSNSTPFTLNISDNGNSIEEIIVATAGQRAVYQ